MPIFRPPVLNLSSLSGHLQASIERGQYSNFGPAAEELTGRLAQHLDVAPDCIALSSNATVAIEAAVATFERGQSTRGSSTSWGVPAWSFAATGLALLSAQANLNFLDVADSSGLAVPNNSFPEQPVLGVAPFGAAPIGDEFDRFQIIDAAASFDGSMGIGRSLSPHQGAVISLHATKLVSAGEGGLFFSHDSDWVGRVKEYLSFGFEAGARESNRRGTNGKLSEIGAATALSSLDDWAVNREKLLDLHHEAREATERAGLTAVGGMSDGVATPYWVVRFPSREQRARVIEALNASGVESRLWWSRGMHRMTTFKEVAGSAELPKTDSWANTYLGLPMHTFLRSKDIGLIGDILAKVRGL